MAKERSYREHAGELVVVFVMNTNETEPALVAGGVRACCRSTSAA
jgi:hypothetical protein